jgi:hypothetical protein
MLASALQFLIFVDRVRVRVRVKVRVKVTI